MKEEWVKIFSAYSESEAYIIKGILEGEGIFCRVKSLRVSQFPLTINGLGEIKIYVFKDEAEKSREILQSYKNKI